MLRTWSFDFPYVAFRSFATAEGADAAITFRRTDALPRLRQVGELANPDFRGQIPRAIEELEAIEEPTVWS